MTDFRDECCGGCRYWHCIDGNDGECLRYPPIVTVRRVHADRTVDATTHRPPTMRGETCGEWAQP